MSRMIKRIALVGLLAALTGSGGGPSAAADDAGVLGLTIALIDDRWYRTEEDIGFRVTVANKTADDLVACFENSRIQKKVITFRLYNDRGMEVTSQPSLHVDYGVTIEEDTVVLPPFGEHVGTVRLEREYLPRAQGCRTINVVAVYHCPFSSDEVIRGHRLRVAAGLVTSEPVTVRVDSRSWLKRVFGGECP